MLNPVHKYIYITKGRHISGNSQAMDSAIGEHLLPINSCRSSYKDDCFSVLHRDREKIHLNILEAIYIAINPPPSMETVKQSYFKYFWGSIGDWGDLNFFHPVPSIQLFNLHPVFNYFCGD